MAMKLFETSRRCAKVGAWLKAAVTRCSQRGERRSKRPSFVYFGIVCAGFLSPYTQPAAWAALLGHPTPLHPSSRSLALPSRSSVLQSQAQEGLKPCPAPRWFHQHLSPVGAEVGKVSLSASSEVPQ